MSRLKRSSLNMLSSAMGYIIPMAVNLITTPLLLNALGASAYGLQSLVSVIIGYLTFMDMGLDLPIMKFLAEFRAHKDIKAENHLLSTTFQLYLFIGLVGMISILILSKWLTLSVFKIPVDMVNEALIVFQLAGLGFLGSVGMSWGRSLAAGLQRFDITASVSVIVNTAGTLIGLGIVYLGYGVVGYVLTRTILTTLAGPLYFILTKHLLPDFSFNKGLHRETLKKVRSYLGFGTFNRIVSSLVSRLDQTLLGIWVGIAAAGIYAVPFLIINSLAYMLACMLGFIFPMASELYSLGETDRFRDIFIRSSQFVAALAGIIFIPLFILGDSFLKLWIPNIASQASGVFSLLCIVGYIGSLTTTLPNNIIIGIGKIRQFSIYMTVRSILLAVSFFFFIRQLGMIGAGWALLSMTIIDIIYFVIVIKHYLHIISIRYFLLKAYFKPIILTLGIAAITVVLRPLAVNWFGLLGIVIILGFSFILGGFLIGVFGDTEKRALKEMLRISKK